MTKPAILGGTPARDIKTNPWPKWPVWDNHEANALLEVLNSGVWSYNGPKETEFNLFIFHLRDISGHACSATFYHPVARDGVQEVACESKRRRRPDGSPAAAFDALCARPVQRRGNR